MTRAPSAITNRRGSRLLEVAWPDGRVDRLDWEYLRVQSPSAEVQGHGQPRVIPGKRKVAVTRVVPVGRYAVRLVFDDGHDSGLFSWELLDALAKEYPERWQRYLDDLQAMGMSRDSEVATLNALRPKKVE